MTDDAIIRQAARDDYYGTGTPGDWERRPLPPPRDPLNPEGGDDDDAQERVDS